MSELVRNQQLTGGAIELSQVGYRPMEFHHSYDPNRWRSLHLGLGTAVSCFAVGWLTVFGYIHLVNESDSRISFAANLADPVIHVVIGIGLFVIAMALVSFGNRFPKSAGKFTVTISGGKLSIRSPHPFFGADQDFVIRKLKRFRSIKCAGIREHFIDDFDDSHQFPHYVGLDAKEFAKCLKAANPNIQIDIG